MLYPWQTAVTSLLDACDRPCVVMIQGGRGKSYLRLVRGTRDGEVWLEEEDVQGNDRALDVLGLIAERLRGRIVLNLLPGSELAPEEDAVSPVLEVDGVRAWVLPAHAGGQMDTPPHPGDCVHSSP